jgi:hypothetical protein
MDEFFDEEDTTPEEEMRIGISDALEQLYDIFSKKYEDYYEDSDDFTISYIMSVSDTLFDVVNQMPPELVLEILSNLRDRVVPPNLTPEQLKLLNMPVEGHA